MLKRIVADDSIVVPCLVLYGLQNLLIPLKYTPKRSS